MPIYNYQDLEINYTRTGNGQTLLFLHGWGANLESFNCISEPLAAHYEVIALDFPGFGKSTEPKSPWQLDDYTQMTLSFINELNLKNVHLIGHSFGGRVSIKLSQMMTPTKIMLLNSAGIKPKRNSLYYFKVYGYKAFKTIASLPLLSWVLKEPLEAYRELHSSSDYKMATPIMKQTLTKVVNEDLTPLLSKISVPVLLIWGDQDTSTPVEDAKKMAARIPDSGLVIFEGAGHFSYLEQPDRTLTILKSFIGGL